MSTTVGKEQLATEEWLECQLDKGMFSDEIAVTYPAVGKMQKSVFVSKAEVRGTAGQRGKVRVRVVRRNNDVIAVLPTEYQDIVFISEQEISAE